MRRRKLLIGMGALAAGSGTAMGTGAFDAASMDRDANIDVVADQNGLLALRSTTDSDVIRETNDGDLIIDFTADSNAGGVNVDSRYQVGELFGVGSSLSTGSGNSPTNNSAFDVVNQDTISHSVTIEYEHTGSLNTDGSELQIQARPGADDLESNAEPTKNIVVNSNSSNPSMTFTDGGRDDRLESGGRIGVSLLVDTTGSNADPDDEDLSGRLRISAN